MTAIDPDPERAKVKNGTHVETKAPDGGWGWIIVLCAMVLNFMIGGAVNTFGVIYVELLEIFRQSASKTAWVGSMANAMGLLLGPLSSALSAKFSCRVMVIIGGILAASGWVLTGFMPRLEYMFLTYGLLAGIGKSLAYTPSIVIVGQWFDKRRALANGLSVAGAGVGTFAFAPLLETLLKNYEFKYTMLIMGGVMLSISVCGAFFRSVPKEEASNNHSPETKSRDDDTKANSEKDYENESNKRKNVPEAIEAISVVAAYMETNLEDTKAASNDNTTHEHRTEPTKESNGMKGYLDYTLLKNPDFMCFGVSVMLATLGHSPASVMLPPLAIQNHVTSTKAAFLLSITGIVDIFGRLLFGALCDIKYIKNNRVYLYVASIFISGIANISCGFSNVYWHFATYAAIFGLFAGSYNALTPVILVDLLGATKLSSSFGLALLFQGIGFLLGPPMAGWMRDWFGSYRSAFWFAGVSMILSSIVIKLPLLCHSCQHRKSFDINTNDTGHERKLEIPMESYHKDNLAFVSESYEMDSVGKQADVLPFKSSNNVNEFAVQDAISNTNTERILMPA